MTLRDHAKQLVKGWLAAARGAFRQNQLRQSQPHVTADRITHDLTAMGICQGDTLFIHSSLKSLGYVEGGPKAVIQGLLDAVGPDGTLILPTYYMPGGTILGTCQMEGYVFDPRVHGTHMGALPTAFLQFPGVQRSIHPTHSVSAIGRHARYITDAHHLAPSVFGRGSPWQRFHEINGKVLGMGISMGPVTFYHFVEDTMGDRFPIHVWTDETFHLPCKGWNGEDHRVPVRPYKQELMAVRIDHPSREDLRRYMLDSLTSNRLLKAGVIGNAHSWVIGANDLFDHLQKLAADSTTIYSKTLPAGN